MRSHDSEIGDYNCGLAYFSCQSYDQAIASLNKAITIFNGLLVDSNVIIPALAAAYYYCGLAHFNKGNFKQAIKNLQEADYFYPNDQEIMKALKDAQREAIA